VWLSLLRTHGIQEPKDRSVAADAEGKSEDDDTSEVCRFPGNRLRFCISPQLSAVSKLARCGYHLATSCWPPSMSYVAPVSAVLLMR
jgi:hypothetical protein